MATFDKRGEIEINGKKMYRYRLRVSNGIDNNGKRSYLTKTITASSDSAAKKRLSIFISEIERGEAASDTNMTFSEFSNKWLRDYASTRLAPKTLQEWQKRLENRIIPKVGSFKLSKIKAATLISLFPTSPSLTVRIKKKVVYHPAL